MTDNKKTLTSLAAVSDQTVVDNGGEVTKIGLLRKRDPSLSTAVTPSPRPRSTNPLPGMGTEDAARHNSRITAWFAAILSGEKGGLTLDAEPLAARDVRSKLAQPRDKLLNIIAPQRGVLMIDVSAPGTKHIEMLVCGPTREVIFSALRKVRAALLTNGGMPQ